MVLEKASDGIYTPTTAATYSSVPVAAAISRDQAIFLIAGQDGEVVIFEKSGTSYLVKQTISHPSTQLTAVRLSEDRRELFVGTFDSELLAYRDNGQEFILDPTINLGFRSFFISHMLNKLEVNGHSPEVLFFEHDGTMYQPAQTITTTSSFIPEIVGSKDFSRFIFGGYGCWKIEFYENLNGTYERMEEAEIGQDVYEVVTDSDWLYFIVSTYQPSLEILYRCPEECTNCSFPNNCTSCKQGHILKGGTCWLTTNCVQNKFVKGRVCEEYCHRKCKSCNQTRTDCIECADFYARDEKGECVAESQVLDIMSRIRPMLNFVKRRGVKALFLTVEDLWLYNYHRNQYDGTALVVFETIQFI